MSTFKGIFELQSPSDLLKKLRHDLNRMEDLPHDQYAAFDFFVTANSMVDWFHPDQQSLNDGKPSRDDLLKNNALLRIASHLANGSKHFHALGKSNQSVTNTEKMRYVDEFYMEPGYCLEPLLIHLNKKEAAEIGASDTCVDAIELASHLVDFWSKQIPLPVS